MSDINSVDSQNDDNMELDEHNWKFYEAGAKRIDMLNQRQGEEDDKADKWMMTMASGSFGLSFAFIGQIVKFENARHFEFLIAAWSCFLAVLIVGFIGFMVSSFVHTAMAVEEANMLKFKYEGKKNEYKNRSVYFSVNAVMGYASILLFIGGSLCLILFIAKNLLKL